MLRLKVRLHFIVCPTKSHDAHQVIEFNLYSFALLICAERRNKSSLDIFFVFICFRNCMCLNLLSYVTCEVAIEKVAFNK